MAYGEEQKLGKHPSPYMFPDSKYSPLPGFPEPVEFDLVALKRSSAPPSFCIHDILWQGIPPISSTMLHEVFLFTFICLWLTSSYCHKSLCWRRQWGSSRCLVFQKLYEFWKPELYLFSGCLFPSWRVQLALGSDSVPWISLVPSPEPF